jgi:F-type H+-transporting ATPase subunit delta
MATRAQTRRTDGYAGAISGIAAAQPDPAAFVDTFFSAAMAMAGNRQLRDALADPSIPADRKQAIIDELLGGRADRVVVAALDFLVAAGQGKNLDEIASRVAELAAEREGAVVAEVRSAVPLDAKQVERITAALSRATGKQVEVKVVTDPSVIGGIVAQVGDTVFDGSVRSRFEELREQWG